LGIGGKLNGARAGEPELSEPGSTGVRAPEDHGREPMVVELEEEFNSSSSIFLHSAMQVKGINPSTLHTVMSCFSLKVISHAGLKHLIICL
jgi:hypothetical protein